MALITTITRITIALTTSTLLMAPATDLSDLTVRRPADNEAPRTVEQQQLVAFAYQRYADHGLALPEVNIEFHPGEVFCGGKFGIYFHSSRSIHMCTLNKRTMLHELAHAWAEENLDEATRTEFMAFRGLDNWRDHDAEWEERATEHAAEFIAWGLIDDPIHVPYIVEAGGGETRTSYRLVTVPDSDIAKLFEGFEMLTGQEPRFRDASESEPVAATSSPESLRMTAAAQPRPPAVDSECFTATNGADRVLLPAAGGPVCEMSA